MKELSIEQKAQRYDEALEKARQLCAYPTTKPFISDLQDIFTELAESEDEEIRKSLISFLKSPFINESITDERVAPWIAWLERQGEKPQRIISAEAKEAMYDKPADKVEPKFKVGNKIKLAKEPKYPAREIIAIRNDAYYFDEKVYLPFSRQDEWELVEQKSIEWSEEDRETIDYLIDYLESELDSSYTDLDKETFTKEINLLKSLRPQSHWKPTEEQMDALESAVSSLQSTALESLYRNLKGYE